MKKRVFAMVLCLCLVVSLLPMTAMAAPLTSEGAEREEIPLGEEVQLPAGGLTERPQTDERPDRAAAPVEAAALLADEYHMYAGDYTPAASKEAAEADEANKNKVYFYEEDSKLYLAWSCPSTGTLVYHKDGGTISNYSGFIRYYCEAYISPAESSGDIKQTEQFTATGGDLNIGMYGQSGYCSTSTTEPYIKVGQWLKDNTAALPSGNLWIKVMACESVYAFDQMSVCFWINAGEVSKLVPGTDLYVSSSGDDTTGNGTRENPYATIGKAYAQAAYNGDTIIVLDDLTLSSTVTFDANKAVTVTSDGETAHSIKRGFGAQATSGGSDLLKVTGGALTLTNVTLGGGYDAANSANNYGRMLNVAGGTTVTLGEGASITNASTGTANDNLNKSIVSVNSGAAFTLDGGAITNNQTAGATAFTIQNNGTVNLRAGTISGNNHAKKVYNNGTLNYYGGTISDEIYLESGKTIALYALPGSLNIGTTASAAGTLVAEVKLDGVTTAQLNNLIANSTYSGAGSGLAVEDGNIVISGSNLYVDGGDAGSDTSGDGTKAKPYKTLDKALSQVSDHCRIILLGDANYTIDYNGTGSNARGKTVTICSDSADAIHTVHIVKSETNSRFHLPDNTGDKLTLENVTIDGTGGNGGIFGVFFIGSGSVLTLNEGATLTHMDARAINIRAGGKVVMSGGKITGNTAGANNRYAGDNYTGTANAGAAVYVCPSGTFEMNGGEISDNYSAAGGAVYSEAGGTVKLSGLVTIKHNYTDDTKRQDADVYIGRYNNVDGPVKLAGPLTSGSRIGVYAKGLDNATENTVVVIAEPSDSHTITLNDMACFSSNKSTDAGIRMGRETDTGGDLRGKIVLAVDAKAKAIGAVDSQGVGTLTADVTNAFKYALLDAEGNEVTDVKAYYPDGNEVAKTGDWFTPDNACEIVFKPLPVGVEVNLVSTSISNDVEPGDESTNKTAVGIPAVSDGQLSAQVANGKTTLTIDPATPNTSYALVDGEGSVVKFDADGKADASGTKAWMTATDGKVVFSGLDCDKQYTIVAAPTGDAMPADDGIKALAGNADLSVTVTTPTLVFRGIDPDEVSHFKSGADDGTSAITVYPTVSGQQYAVIDPATGETVGEWKTSTDGGAVTFEVLDETKAYQVVTRQSETTVPGVRVDVPPAGTGEAVIDIQSGSLTELKLAGGMYSYKLGNAKVTGKGANTFEIAVDTGYFTVDTTDSPKGGASFYASLTTNGALATTGTPRVGANYTYLQFRCGAGTTPVHFLQEYLREHVTFHRPAEVDQTVTAVAENVTLPTEPRVEAFLGHYYRFVPNAAINWSNAYAGARARASTA